MVALGGGAVSYERGSPVGGDSFLMSEVPLFLMCEVPLFLMSEVPLFLMSEVPLFLMSEVPLFLMSEVPLYRWRDCWHTSASRRSPLESSSSVRSRNTPRSMGYGGHGVYGVEEEGAGERERRESKRERQEAPLALCPPRPPIHQAI